MRVLITGSQGHVGRFVTQALQDDHDLTLLDAREAPEPHQHRFILGDLMDEAVCRRAVEGMEAIVHLAANPTPYGTRVYERNTVSTWNLADAAANAGVRRFAFASTINVCGLGKYKLSGKEHTPPYLPLDENSPLYPEDCYALSKVANEQALRGLADAHGLEVYCLRLCHVWSPAKTESYVPPPLDRVPPLTANRIIDPWHYIDGRDVAAAFHLAVEARELAPFGVSYLVADDTTRPEPTMDILQRFLPEWMPLAGDRLPGHAPWFSNAAAKRDLGWWPAHTWRDRSEHD